MPSTFPRYPTKWAYINFVFLSLTLLPLLGFFYAYALWYAPFIYLNFVLSVGTGTLIGFLLNSAVIRPGFVLSPILSIALALLAASISLYFHWAVWISLFANAGDQFGSDSLSITLSSSRLSDIWFFLHPNHLLQSMQQVNQSGTWTFQSLGSSDGVSPKGWSLTIIWILEFLLITFLSCHKPTVTSIFLRLVSHEYSSNIEVKPSPDVNSSNETNI